MNKKAVINLISISLMLSVMILASIFLFQWFNKYSSEKESEFIFIENKLKLINSNNINNEIIYETQHATSSNNIIIYDQSGNIDCTNSDITVSNTNKTLTLDISACSLNDDELYDIQIITTDSSYSYDSFVK